MTKKYEIGFSERELALLVKAFSDRKLTKEEIKLVERLEAILGNMPV